MHQWALSNIGLIWSLACTVKISMKNALFAKIIEKREKNEKTPFLVDLVPGCEKAIFSLWSHQMMHFTRLGRHEFTCTNGRFRISLSFGLLGHRPKKKIFNENFEISCRWFWGHFSHIDSSVRLVKNKSKSPTRACSYQKNICKKKSDDFH